MFSDLNSFCNFECFFRQHIISRLFFFCFFLFLLLLFTNTLYLQKTSFQRSSLLYCLYRAARSLSVEAPLLVRQSASWLAESIQDTLRSFFSNISSKTAISTLSRLSSTCFDEERASTKLLLSTKQCIGTSFSFVTSWIILAI